MNSKSPPDDLRTQWQAQTSDEVPLSLDELRRKVEPFDSAIERRNAVEHFAGVLVVIVFGWYAWIAETTLGRVGHGLIVAGTLYTTRRLRARGSAEPVPIEALASSLVAFHRLELERQRDLLRSVWRWYLWPLIPGLLVLFIDGALEAAGSEPEARAPLAISGAICALLFIGIGWLDRLAARKLDDEIRALGASAEWPRRPDADAVA